MMELFVFFSMSLYSVIIGTPLDSKYIEIGKEVPEG